MWTSLALPSLTARTSAASRACAGCARSCSTATRSSRCLMLAPQADGARDDGRVPRRAGSSIPSRGVQQAHGLQCGYCTPAFLLTALALASAASRSTASAARRARGRPVPLHRLPEHRQGGRALSRDDGGRTRRRRGDRDHQARRQREAQGGRAAPPRTRPVRRRHRRPAVLHMAVVRCPYPHARIRRIDATRALELEAARGRPAGRRGRRADRARSPSCARSPVAADCLRAMAQDVALYEGEPVARGGDRPLHGGGRGRARRRRLRAAAAVVIDEDALGPGAPCCTGRLRDNLLVVNPACEGDPEQALAEAAEVVVGHLPHQPRERPANGDARDRGALHAGTQHARGAGRRRRCRTSAAQLAQCAPPSRGRHPCRRARRRRRLRPQAGDLPGGRPRLPASRSTSAGRSSGSRTAWSTSAATTHAPRGGAPREDRAPTDGRILALRDTYVVDAGAYNSPLGSPMLPSSCSPGPY